MLRRASITALVLAVAFGMATPGMAQTTNGVISGIISDAQGGVLPGVSVTGRNPDTGLTRTVVTESDGRFRLAALPPGRYELKAELPGFGTVDVPAKNGPLLKSREVKKYPTDECTNQCSNNDQYRRSQ